MPRKRDPLGSPGAWFIDLGADLEDEVVHAKSIRFRAAQLQGTWRTGRLGPRQVPLIELSASRNEGRGHTGLSEAHSAYANRAKPVTTVVNASRSTTLLAPKVECSIASNTGIREEPPVRVT